MVNRLMLAVLIKSAIRVAEKEDGDGKEDRGEEEERRRGSSQSEVKNRCWNR